MRSLLPLLFAVLSAPVAAEVVRKPVSYSVDGVEMASTLVYDASVDTPRPALVLVPNWMGANAAAIDKAAEIAGSRYVVLVADVYGKDVRPADAGEAGKAAQGMYADRPALRKRVAAALEQLQAAASSAPIAPGQFGAIGFCFGGATVLELARSGADIAGVVSFHGNLSTSLPAEAGKVQASVLVLNGADDTYVPAAQIDAFLKEMTMAGVDWQFVNYAGAVHCFAEPDANSGPGCLYHPRSARRAYAAMDAFFAERFAAAD